MPVVDGSALGCGDCTLSACALTAVRRTPNPPSPQVFGTDVNGLPLSLDLSWLEQKAVIILLTLLVRLRGNVWVGMCGWWGRLSVWCMHASGGNRQPTDPLPTLPAHPLVQHLDVKNIRIGPKAPAFLTNEALAVIVDKW